MLNKITKESKNIEIIDFLKKSNTRIVQNINHKKQLFNNLASLCKDELKLNQKEISEFLHNKELIESSSIGNGVDIFIHTHKDPSYINNQFQSFEPFYVN